jgi:hypothetical protein
VVTNRFRPDAQPSALRNPPSNAAHRAAIRNRAGVPLGAAIAPDPNRSSIGGHRTSGFLQVSLSKVLRFSTDAHPSVSSRGTSDER